MPWVWRRSRCAISQAPATPTTSTASAATTMSQNSSTQQVVELRQGDADRDQRDDGRPGGPVGGGRRPKTGTIARIDGPSVPTYSSV